MEHSTVWKKNRKLYLPIPRGKLEPIEYGEGLGNACGPEKGEKIH